MYGKRCVVHSANKSYRAYIPRRIQGVSEISSKPVCVGDQVIFIKDKAQQFIIKEVKERKTKLSRKAIGPVEKEQVVVSNVDQLLIVTSLAEPAFHPGIIDRFLIAAHKGNLEPIICVNKMDLAEKIDDLESVIAALEVYRQLDYTVICTSATTKEDLSFLKQILKDKSTVLGGHSGVGKSSLLLAIDPELNLRTQEVGQKSKRGQHTTSSVMLLPLKFGGYVVDTPGVREFSLWQTEVAEVDQYFPEIFAKAPYCKYRGCSHTHEPNCAVQAAVEAGEIAFFRYQSYAYIIESIQNPTLASRPPRRDA